MSDHYWQGIIVHPENKLEYVVMQDVGFSMNEWGRGGGRSLTKYVLLVLFVVGFYFPTSFHQEISKILLLSLYFIVFSMLAAISLLKKGRCNIYLFLNSIVILFLLFLFTLLSPFDEYAFGAILGYLALSLLYIVDLRNISIGRGGDITLTLINIINIIFSTLIVLDYSVIHDFFKDNYSDFRPDLLTEMITWHSKPILTLGSHSVASFFMYLFFLLNFKKYIVSNKNIFLIFSILYLVILLRLQSVTSFIFLSISIIQIIYYILIVKPLSVNKVVIYFFCLILLLLFYLFFGTSAVDLNLFYHDIVTILGSKSNGLVGRFSGEGILKGTIAYMQEYPFSPVGLSYSKDIFFGDSGPVLALLRGSIFLFLSVYGGLFLFLRFNLLSKSTAYWIFAVIVAFEIGFSVLTYHRFLAFLPFVVVFLNDLEREKRKFKIIEPSV